MSARVTTVSGLMAAALAAGVVGGRLSGEQAAALTFAPTPHLTQFSRYERPRTGGWLEIDVYEQLGGQNVRSAHGRHEDPARVSACADEFAAQWGAEVPARYVLVLDREAPDGAPALRATLNGEAIDQPNVPACWVEVEARAIRQLANERAGVESTPEPAPTAAPDGGA
jgi:hypothetical protein